MKEYTDEFEIQSQTDNLVVNSTELSAPLVRPSNLYALRLDKLLLTFKDCKKPQLSYNLETPARQLQRKVRPSTSFTTVSRNTPLNFYNRPDEGMYSSLNTHGSVKLKCQFSNDASIEKTAEKKEILTLREPTYHQDVKEAMR